MTRLKNLLVHNKTFGIAIYPNRAPKQTIITYLKRAHKYGFKRVFTNLIGLSKGELKNFIEVCQFGKKLGLTMVVDIDDKTCKKLGHSFTDQAYFQKLGVSGIRLDVKFEAQKIGALTLKKETEYEINASDFAGLDQELASVPFEPRYLIASHNFYPQPYTGLSKRKFLKANSLYKKLGIKISAFVTIQNKNAIAAWKEAQGTPTLEDHRNMDLINQIQYLGLIDSVDIIIVSNMYLSDQEMLAIQSLEINSISLALDKTSETKEVEQTILSWDGHQISGDNGDYFWRSRVSRHHFKDLQVLPRPHFKKFFYKGDVVILNENAGRYQGELHILKKTIPASSDKNFVGTINKSQFPLLNFDKPGLKFTFWK